jgi:hypothetical protein
VRSREHIFPQWLLRHYNAASTSIEPTYMVIDEQKTVNARRSTFGGLLEGRICVDCDSGWMRRLESEAQGVLLSLADRDRPLSRLADDERRPIASWAAKTAYTLNSAANFPLKVPPDHLHRLARESRLADGVNVYGALAASTCQLADSEGGASPTKMRMPSPPGFTVASTSKFGL